MSFSHRYPLNVPGKFYVDDQCTDCDYCRECAPLNICRDDRFGHSYVYKQPETDEELVAIEKGLNGCPTEAVWNNGDQYDWSKEPIIDWNSALSHFGNEVHFELDVPVIPHEVTLEEDRLARIQWLAERRKPWWKRFIP